MYLANLPILRKSRLIDEAMLNYYADQYSKRGLQGTSKLVKSRAWIGLLTIILANWYRTKEQNFQDELS